MAKNWLIRTKKNKILGPVSREKIVELLDKGSLKTDDEICAGNGYWFYINEKDHLEAYLIKGLQQPFNPVCEAKDIITINKPKNSVSIVETTQRVGTVETFEKEQDSDSLEVEIEDQDSSSDSQLEANYNLPSNDDLEFPDSGQEEDFTIVGNVGSHSPQVGDVTVVGKVSGAEEIDGGDDATTILNINVEDIETAPTLEFGESDANNESGFNDENGQNIQELSLDEIRESAEAVDMGFTPPVNEELIEEQTKESIEEDQDVKELLEGKPVSLATGKNQEAEEGLAGSSIKSSKINISNDVTKTDLELEKEVKPIRSATIKRPEKKTKKSYDRAWLYTFIILIIVMVGLILYRNIDFLKKQLSISHLATMPVAFAQTDETLISSKKKLII